MYTFSYFGGKPLWPADETPVLQLEIERQPEANIVHCTGKVVIDSWAMFSVTVRALIPEGKPILVDLAKVTPGG